LGTNLMQLTQIGLIPPEEQITFYSIGLLIFTFVFVNLALFHCKLGQLVRGKFQPKPNPTKPKEIAGE
jgi:hypothetical protein